MLISAFTFLRNAHKLYYPISESIQSILPLVDEFVIALGAGDAEDTSREIIEKINSSKIKIIETSWQLDVYKNGSIYAQQTDLAKSHCKGDWLFYLQGDELIHEHDIEEIKENCIKFKADRNIEGFVFNYLHFFGDYEHYFSDHCWYKREIRIIRNVPEIHSWRDAQSFRFHNGNFKEDYFTKTNTRKLKCKLLKARVFHYGWVRPPHIMKQKNNAAESYYSIQKNDEYQENFDYGRLDFCKKFEIKNHPSLIQNRIKELNWQHLLRSDGPNAFNRPLMKHEKTKYRILSFVEENLLGGHVIGGFKNYELV